jgi:FtsZ-binding cell division protein ZapB
MKTNRKNKMTKTITKFDKPTLRNLRVEMQALLEAYGVETNLEISVGNMSYSDAEVNIKIQAKVKGAVTMTDRILQMEVDRLGLKMVNFAGDKLVSYKTRAQKYSFVYESHGKLYKTDERGVKARFAA